MEGSIASHIAAPLFAAPFHDDGAVRGTTGHLVGAVAGGGQRSLV